jgi:hypothetical protein
VGPGGGGIATDHSVQDRQDLVPVLGEFRPVGEERLNDGEATLGGFRDICLHWS